MEYKSNDYAQKIREWIIYDLPKEDKPNYEYYGLTDEEARQIENQIRNLTH